MWCKQYLLRMWQLILVSLCSHLIMALQPSPFHFIGFPQQKKQTLCDIGCKCPEKGRSLMLLDCGKRGISKLPTAIQFDPLVNSVNFQGNHIEELRENTFSKADNIQQLDLSVNQISKIDNSTFSPFKSLALLRVSHNRLSEIEPGLLDGLYNLRVLELGHNYIQKLSPVTFQVTPNLQELRLQYNPIFDLPEQLLQYLPHLEKLDLQDTGLVTLPPNLFKPTPRLQWLSVSNNAFEMVPEEALSHAPLLENLDLSGNDFVTLVPGAFRRLSHVSVLYLNNLERLSGIEKDAFAGLVRLKSLSCSYNKKLNYIDENAFGGENSSVSEAKTPPKEQLYLRQNALRTLKSPLEPDSWSSLGFVDLADNPWKCDCTIQWMIFLRKETQMNIICNSPPRLKGRSFISINPSELACEDHWTYVSFILVVSSLLALGVVFLAASAIVCSRTPLGMYIRSKKQFSYAKVVPKTETVDLEWDPTADL